MTVDRKSGRSSSFLSISNHKTYHQLYSRPYAVVSSSSLPLFQVGHTDLPIEPSLNTPNTLLYHQLQKSGSGNLPTILTRELVGVDDLHSLSLPPISIPKFYPQLCSRPHTVISSTMVPFPQSIRIHAHTQLYFFLWTISAIS